MLVALCLLLDDCCLMLVACCFMLAVCIKLNVNLADTMAHFHPYMQVILLQYCRGPQRGRKTPNAPDLQLLNKLFFEQHYSGPRIDVKTAVVDAEVSETYLLPSNVYLAYSTLADSR